MNEVGFIKKPLVGAGPFIPTTFMVIIYSAVVAKLLKFESKTELEIKTKSNVPTVNAPPAIV